MWFLHFRECRLLSFIKGSFSSHNVLKWMVVQAVQTVTQPGHPLWWDDCSRKHFMSWACRFDVSDVVIRICWLFVRRQLLRWKLCEIIRFTTDGTCVDPWQKRICTVCHVTSMQLQFWLRCKRYLKWLSCYTCSRRNETTGCIFHISNFYYW